MEEKVVILHGFSADELSAILKAVKAAIAEPGAIAFATSTPTNLDWKLGDVLEHVREEHRLRSRPRLA